MSSNRDESEVRNAMKAADDEAASPVERAEMLMEIAMGLQVRPRSADQLHSAVQLYDRAIELCPEREPLLRARITARKATALQAIPDGSGDCLEAARVALSEATPVLRAHGSAEETAEAEMNCGLVLQSLSGMHRARITDAIAAYQRALRTFDRTRFPKEFAILQNNLATAFLSIPFSDERSKMREALAVQAFEEGLKTVNIIDHPAEYAMLQNNLGNALQYASSSHAVENNLRALDAYDEALKVRSRDNMPIEYANTISNKANCLLNLPDDVAHPEFGNRENLLAARAYYTEARAIFNEMGEADKARIIADVQENIEREVLAQTPSNGSHNRSGNGASSPA